MILFYYSLPPSIISSISKKRTKVNNNKKRIANYYNHKLYCLKFPGKYNEAGVKRRAKYCLTFYKQARSPLRFL